MNVSPSKDFSRTGRVGTGIDIGNGREHGASRAISRERNNRDRN